MDSETTTDELLAWLQARIDGGDTGRPLGAGYQAVLHLYQTPCGPVVVKRARPSRILGPLNRALLRREEAAYARLRGVPGIPRAFGLMGGDRLVLEHIEGSSLRQTADLLVDRERFYAGLRRTLDAMHSAGVAHGDLKRKDNILVGPGEQAFVIDFGAAWMADPHAARWRRWVFERIAQTDDNAWVKLKYRRRFDEVTEEDRKHYRPQWLERLARWIRVPYQKITLRRWRKRRRLRHQARHTAGS